MKILVTGGAGFIGSHIADALSDLGHQVAVLDDLSTGRRENVRKGLHLEPVDIRTPQAAQFVLGEQFEVVYHLAAQMDVRKSVADPSWDADVNIRGLVNLCQAAVKAGTRRIVFASTGGAIYGEQDVFPAPETHPIRPVSPYGVAKAASEMYLYFFRAEYGLSYTAMRFANVYGPRQNPHGEAGVVAIFCGKLLKGDKCTIYGDGAQTRDYVYVGDVVRACVAALDSDFCGAVNVGTGVETNVLALHAKLCRAAGMQAEPVMAAARPGEQKRSAIDPGMAAKILGWSPGVGLDEGLKRTLDSFRT